MKKQCELSLNELDAVIGAGVLEYIKETYNALVGNPGNSGETIPLGAAAAHGFSADASCGG